jgi:hypothetical protein
MKIILIIFFIIINTYAKINSLNNSNSCHEILQQIKELEEEKKINIVTSLSAIFIGKAYSYDNPNKKINIKIKLLEFELSDCQ